MKHTVSLRGSLSLPSILAVARGEKVYVAPEVVRTLRSRRTEVVSYVTKTHEPSYGFNRGFGHNCGVPVSDEGLTTLQQDYTRSHACGVGPCAPREIIRAAMLLRAQSLARGYSGVRPQLVQTIVQFLNADIVPEVPQFGSVGASGDLAPLAHIALGLMGEGRAVTKGGKLVPITPQLRRHGIKPLELEMKEGLALNNGVQFSMAYAIFAHDLCSILLRQAALNTALVAQVMLGADTPFLAALHELRPHPGSKAVAKWIWDLMQGSPIRESHRSIDIDGEVQDPYNIRCAAQILGACHDLLSECQSTLEIEARSVTDNPIILRNPKSKKHDWIVSGGHFHGMPVAVKLYSIMQAMGIMARLANMRCVRFVDEARNKGLGSDLIHPKLSELDRSTSSGMMIAEYVTAALTNHLWGQAMPSHLFSLSTDAGQEDHVSMSAGLAVRVWEALPRLAEILAIELAFCVQAAHIRKLSESFPVRGNRPPHHWKNADRKLSPVCERVIAAAAKIFPPVKRDRVLSYDLQKLAQEVMSGKLVAVIDK